MKAERKVHCAIDDKAYMYTLLLEPREPRYHTKNEKKGHVIIGQRKWDTVRREVPLMCSEVSPLRPPANPCRHSGSEVLLMGLAGFLAI